MCYSDKCNPLFLLASAAVLGILSITPNYFRNDYIALLDGICLLGLLLNSYLYVTSRSRFLVTIAALCQLIYCLGASSMDVEEEFIYTRLECLRGVGMHAVKTTETLEAAAMAAALVFIILEVALIAKLLMISSRTQYGF
jgi:hypothetical protein